MRHESDSTDVFDLGGQVAVLTGGLGQLGRRFGAALTARGARVAVFDVRCGADPGAATGNGVLQCRVDVRKRASIEEGLRAVTAAWGTPTALINAAALDSPPTAPPGDNGPFETFPESSWEQVLDVNLGGAWRCCQVVGGAMADAGRGVVVNISSVYGMLSPDQRLYAHLGTPETPFVKPVAYCASKSGLLNLTRYLATYWGPRGVRVNTLTLGGVRRDQDPRFLDAYAARVPLGRMADEDEYSGAIVFLLSAAASYMTGANLVIDGGWTAW